MVRRQRFGKYHVESGAKQVAARERVMQRIEIQNVAAAGIDHD